MFSVRLGFVDDKVNVVRIFRRFCFVEVKDKVIVMNCRIGFEFLGVGEGVERGREGFLEEGGRGRY